VNNRKEENSLKKFKVTRRTYTSYDELPLMLSVKDVSLFLRLSISKTYLLTGTDGFPRLNLGERSRVLVPKAPFIEWVEKNTIQ